MDNQKLAQWAALREVELFLFREAELADQHQYKEWFALWTEELLYWVPCNSDEEAVGRKIALINDNRPELDERLFRLGTKFAHAQNPKSRLSRNAPRTKSSPTHRRWSPQPCPGRRRPYRTPPSRRGSTRLWR